MERVSINGLLIPSDGSTITDEYLGHFLKVSYIQLISGHNVYGKDRVDVEADGSFRFFVPKKELLVDETVAIEAYAPDGEMLGRQVYSYGSLQAASISENAADDTAPMQIEVDPKVITFSGSSAVEEAFQKISGKVIDVTGENAAKGLQAIVFTSDDAAAEYGSESFLPVCSAVTDAQGYFFTTAPNKSCQQAYALIAGLESQPVTIALESGRLPKQLIVMADLSELSDEVVQHGATPGLPDSADLVNSGAYSQDIGGTCVDFTVPNRTLEEFSYYHTVRTTEPEIRGLTITTQESQRIKGELFGVTDELFGIFSRLNNSFRALSVLSYDVEEEPQQSDAAMNVRALHMASALPENRVQTIYAPPVYQLKLATGTKMLKLNTTDILQVNSGLNFSYLVKLLAEQARRKKKLLELHSKLAAAYCGKNGVQEAQGYCATLSISDALNRDKLASLLGHVKSYAPFVKSHTKHSREFGIFIAELEEMLDEPFISAEVIALVAKKCEKVITGVDKLTVESQDQEELLGYLRRVVRALKQAKEDQLNGFEPCPPAEKRDTMGIMCLIQEFDAIKETLRHKNIFTLGEILSIREHYDTFLNSITAFVQLLEEFYSFYRSSKNFMITLEDDYFVENYNSIKNTLMQLKRQIYRAVTKIEAIERAYIANHPGRKNLSVETSIDWDETPTVYENTTIAHGHILHFKQKWKADGYSLGDLLYSLPLAPCQEKQIAIVDWDREEQASRIEAQTVSESMEADISRDRDISEIVSSSFTENIYARSTNKTKSTSGGFGAGLGGFVKGITFGLAGGVSHSGASSTSTASQNSARNLAGSSFNRLQDRVNQSASSLRSQRNTVIQTVGQNEAVSVQTEVIKNNNHCHAMTVEYFEVLKHYAIEQELVDVQECLFVPLPMSHFDHQKVLRWSNTLRRGIYGRKLQRGFDAIERIESNYANSDLPVGTYADENIEMFDGHFTISFDLTRPYISTIEEATKTETYNLFEDFPWFFGKMVFNIDREVPLTEAEKDAVFEAQYVPEIVRGFIDTLEVAAIADDGSEVALDLDFTLLSTYRKGAPLKVRIASASVPEISRRQIKYLRFRAATNVKPSSKIILRATYLSYRTQHLNGYIVRDSRVNNDIINSVEVNVDLSTPPFVEVVTMTDAALIYTPLNAREERDPRKEDREAAAALVAFLNEHMEMAHKVIWTSLDASRLFGLLDGYIAPNAGGRSVASVVENKVMGVVGNNLVFKVVPGERLDPVYKGVEDLVGYYRPTTTPDPFRISVPTKGVYAESVMGRCNSCEEIDDTRHWRFEDAPCGSTPTAINPVSTDTRRSDAGSLQVKDLPTNIISMQTTPAALDPTGLAAAFTLLGKGDAFKDMTGLTGTQSNTLKALETTSKSVTDLTKMAADIQKQQSMKKDIDKTLKAIKQAKSDNQIDGDQANALSYSALSSLVGVPTKTDKLTEVKEVQDAIEKASDAKQDIKIERGDESVVITAPKAEEE